MEDTKLCKACNKELPIEEFHRDKSNKDGRNYRCKLCVKLNKSVRPVVKKTSVSLMAIRLSRAITALCKRIHIPVEVKVNKDTTITVTIKGETTDEE